MDKPQTEAEKEFQRRITQALDVHSSAMVDVLRKLIAHDYPKEVESIDFVVFPMDFYSGFPMRVFFLDKNNTEFFITRNGEAEYPSPVDPDLLDIPQLCSASIEEEIFGEDPETDPWTLAGETMIGWLFRRWHEAGGAEFTRAATAALHDDKDYYELPCKGAE